jgi:hypothetical protein
MDEILQKIVEFKWSQDCQESFKFLKNNLVEAPILKFPEWSIKFQVHVDASSIAIESALSQPYDHTMDHPNEYASQNRNKVERNFATAERESLSMIFKLQKFCHYLLENAFNFFVEHQALKYLVNKPIHQGKIC